MKRFAHYVFVRQRHNWLQFLKFGIVGGSGVLVNLAVIFLCNKLGPPYHDAAFPIPLGDYSVRWYHLFQVTAFLVANVWNYQINRSWTFRSVHHRGWFREFFPFLATGVVALIVGLGVTTALLWHGSPLYLRQISWMDESTGLRNPLYWANLIQIIVTMPINFVVNKLWTFRAIRGRKEHPEQELPMVASVVAPEAVDDTGELHIRRELEEMLEDQERRDPDQSEAQTIED